MNCLVLKRFYIWAKLLSINSTTHIFYLSSVLSQILPIFFFFFFRKRLKKKSIWVIFFLLIFSLFSASYSLYLYENGKPNFVSYNVTVLIESILLYYFFFIILNGKIIKRIVFLLIIIFVIFWLFFFTTLGVNVYYDYCSNIENVSILILISIYLFQQVVSINTPYIYRDPNFWVISAYFIYFSGIFFMYIYIDTLSLKEAANYYSLEYVFIIVRSLLLSTAMIIKPVKDNFNNNFSVRQKNFE